MVNLPLVPTRFPEAPMASVESAGLAQVLRPPARRRLAQGQTSAGMASLAVASSVQGLGLALASRSAQTRFVAAAALAARLPPRSWNWVAESEPSSLRPMPKVRRFVARTQQPATVATAGTGRARDS